LPEKETRVSIQNNLDAAIFFGSYDENFRHLAEVCKADLSARGGDIHIRGEEKDVNEAETVIHALLDIVQSEKQLTPADINYTLNLTRKGMSVKHKDIVSGNILTTARGKSIKAKTLGQKNYVMAMAENDVVFAIGPAGTGKTYLAVVMAVRALRNKEVQRIILVRPAVEAGEKLGFLPGDLQEKVDPYLRPLTDALFDILGTELYQRYMERRIIEIAPLAYMRGRTLEDSFIILDEAQNTTSEQMKMFLTRMGWGSKIVVTGDITQIDLPKGQVSGLVEASQVLQDVSGIALIYLEDKDVVRHEMVQKIIQAYERRPKTVEGGETLG
jgi:phosphate starvation-inducible PhoH-like protein